MFFLCLYICFIGSARLVRMFLLLLLLIFSAALLLRMPKKKELCSKHILLPTICLSASIYIFVKWWSSWKKMLPANNKNKNQTGQKQVDTLSNRRIMSDFFMVMAIRLYGSILTAWVGRSAQGGRPTDGGRFRAISVGIYFVPEQTKMCDRNACNIQQMCMPVRCTACTSNAWICGRACTFSGIRPGRKVIRLDINIYVYDTEFAAKHRQSGRPSSRDQWNVLTLSENFLAQTHNFR